MRASLLCLALVSCGPALDFALDGYWDGPVTVEIQGHPTQSYQGRMEVVFRQQVALVGPLCVDGTGMVITSGAGRKLEWTDGGAVGCPPLNIGDCLSPSDGGVRMTYRTGQAEVTGDNSAAVLTASAHGSANWCGVPSDATLSFVGHHSPPP